MKINKPHKNLTRFKLLSCIRTLPFLFLLAVWQQDLSPRPHLAAPWQKASCNVRYHESISWGLKTLTGTLSCVSFPNSECKKKKKVLQAASRVWSLGFVRVEHGGEGSDTASNRHTAALAEASQSCLQQYYMSFGVFPLGCWRALLFIQHDR